VDRFPASPLLLNFLCAGPEDPCTIFDIECLTIDPCIVANANSHLQVPVNDLAGEWRRAVGCPRRLTPHRLLSLATANTYPQTSHFQRLLFTDRPVEMTAMARAESFDTPMMDTSGEDIPMQTSSSVSWVHPEASMDDDSNFNLGDVEIDMENYHPETFEYRMTDDLSAEQRIEVHDAVATDVSQA